MDITSEEQIVMLVGAVFPNVRTVVWMEKLAMSVQAIIFLIIQVQEQK